MNPRQPRTASEVLQALGDRYQAYLDSLEDLAQIVVSHPEWQEQEPQLKAVLSALQKDKEGRSP